MRNQRARLALNVVALYHGFAWLSDYIGTLIGTLAKGKPPARTASWSGGLVCGRRISLHPCRFRFHFGLARACGRPRANAFVCRRAHVDDLPVIPRFPIR